MVESVRWEEVERELDLVERNDWPAVAAVFLRFQGRLLDPRDTPGGRKKSVTVGSFCSRFRLSRHLLASWASALSRESA